MRGPRGRGREPREDGRCVHRWQRADDPPGYRCLYCAAWQPDCPHEWTWLEPGRRWHCSVCGEGRGDTAPAEP